MYRAYYQLQKPVNRKSIPVGELFISASLREAQARLDYMKDMLLQVIIVLKRGKKSRIKITVFLSFLISCIFLSNN